MKTLSYTSTQLGIYFFQTFLQQNTGLLVTNLQLIIQKLKTKMYV